MIDKARPFAQTVDRGPRCSVRDSARPEELNYNNRASGPQNQDIRREEEDEESGTSLE